MTTSSSSGAAGEALKLLRILRLIPAGRDVTAAEIGARLAAAGTPVSERSLQRALRMLAASGDFPIVCDAGGRTHRYRWADGAPAVMLPAPEAEDRLLIDLGRALLAKRLSRTLTPRVLSLLKAPVLPNERVSAKTVLLDERLAPLPARIAESVFSAVVRALDASRLLKVRCRERGRTVERLLSPLGIAAGENTLWLVALPAGTDEKARIGAHPLHRIIEARITAFPSRVPEDFSLSVWLQTSSLNPNRGTLVEIEFETDDQALITQLRETPLSTSQRVRRLGTRVGDPVRVSLTLPDSPLLSAWLAEHADRIHNLSRRTLV